MSSWLSTSVRVWRLSLLGQRKIAGIRLNRRYNLDAPKGVNGRNSDNTLIRQYLDWEPSTRLRDGLERTYAWIYDEYLARYGAPAAV